MLYFGICSPHLKYTLSGASLVHYRHISHRHCLEWIILWRRLLMEVLANHRQLYQDILSYSRNVVEEEQQEEEARSAEYTRHDGA